MSTPQPHLPSLLAQIISLNTDSDVVRIIQDCSDSQLHPIFARDRWEDIADHEFLALGPALVLASNLLKCDRALHFWHALFFGTREGFTDRHGVQHHRFLPVHDTSARLAQIEKDRTMKSLEEMSLAVRLEVQEMAGTHGLCYSGASLQEIPAFTNSHPWSCRSTIAMSRADISALTSTLKFGSAASPLGRWFKLACTFVHEVAHAASNVIDGAAVEGFFGPDAFCEMGHAIIKWLFNCQPFITHLESTKEEVVAVHQLPSLSYVKSYRKRGLFPFLTTLTSAAETVGVVDKTWIKALFLRRTWDHDVPTSDAALLTPPAVFCSCKRCSPHIGAPTKLDRTTASEADTQVTSHPCASTHASCRCVDHAFTFADEVGGGEDEQIQGMLSLTEDQVYAIQDTAMWRRVVETRQRYNHMK